MDAIHFRMCCATVYEISRLGALEERPRPGTQPKLDAQAQARLLAEAVSEALAASPNKPAPKIVFE